jgi:hypothetical protein
VSTEQESMALDLADKAPSSQPAIAARVWGVVGRVLELVGDRLNPILVKETRQALKSRQFLCTFMLLLFLSWGWSILGIANIGPAAASGSHGSEMFVGYFVILAFALMVVVPFGTFRSLAAEQESRTYELLSITALGSRQIVAGKLGSAALQMSVYLSAVSPCLSFTYLLRGIDLLTIFLILFWISLASLGCSAIGLLLATITSRKQFQVIPMIVAVLGFFYGFGLMIAGAISFIMDGGPALYSESGFWVINGALLTGFAAYFVMVCEAAAARLSFASDNQSTRLRVIMLAHYLIFAGWMAAAWMLFPERERETAAAPLLLIFMICVSVHWYIMGALMVGESPRLSSRVKRKLPRSFLGRMFLTWFYPGPGTGYVLALCGLACALLTMGIIAFFGDRAGLFPRRPWVPTVDAICTFGMLAVSYITIYLGLGLLLMRALRRFTSNGLALSVFLQIILVLFGCVVPLVIQWTLPQFRHASYSILQITNPFWSLSEVLSGTVPLETPLLVTFVPAAAVVVFFMNIPGLVREIRNIRIMTPERVTEDDARSTPYR